jgi:hypothetical protein
MQPNNDTDYKQLFSQLIKKQMLVLGPDITLAKVKNVIGLTVDVNGDVLKMEGDPQQMLQRLINQFVELSGMIVKKTMESILTSYPGMMAMASSTAFGGAQAATQPTPTVSTQTATAMADAAQAQVSATPVSETVKEGPQPAEPPPITAMSLDSLTITPNRPHEPARNASQSDAGGPVSFSSKEMQDLNKALEDLSKAPLSTESKTQITQ